MKQLTVIAMALFILGCTNTKKCQTGYLYMPINNDSNEFVELSLYDARDRKLMDGIGVDAQTRMHQNCVNRAHRYVLQVGQKTQRFSVGRGAKGMKIDVLHNGHVRLTPIHQK